MLLLPQRTIPIPSIVELMAYAGLSGFLRSEDMLLEIMAIMFKLVVESIGGTGSRIVG